MARRRPVRQVASRRRSETPLTQAVADVTDNGSVETAIRRIRAEMKAARHEIREGELRIACHRLQRVIRLARAAGLGHAEALWALAVCLDGIGQRERALATIEASIAQDATALVALETREAIRAKGATRSRRRPPRG